MSGRRSRREKMMRRLKAGCAIALIGMAITGNMAWAQDTLKLAVGQRGNWDTSVSELGQRAGIFKKHGLTLELVYTQGAGETQQAVISGSVDIGIAAGVMGVLGAFSKGAPVRIISAETTGAMSGQVDVGWAAPPFGLDQLDKGEIRRIATGNDAAVFKGQTVRLNIANANFLKEHKDIVDRYMKAYRETVDYMYRDP